MEGEVLPDVETHYNATAIIAFPCIGCENGQLTKTE